MSEQLGLFASLRATEKLPGHIQILPAHGAGSACGKSLGAIPTSVLGYERHNNGALRQAMSGDEDLFVGEILAGQPAPPRYFARMKIENKTGPALLPDGKLPEPRRLAPDEISEFVSGEGFENVALDFRADRGAVGAIGGSRLTSLVPEAVLMLLFAVLMILVAIIMLTGERGEVVGQVNCKPGHCLAAGTGVGLLTGFIGVGGGFLLMPALMHFAKLPLRIATGTSLAIVALNSFIGFLSHLGDAPPRWGLSFLFAGIAVVGVIAGGAFASRLPVARLRLIFALVVLATGILVLGQSAF